MAPRSPEIQNRRQLFDCLEDQMNRACRVRHGKSPVKTYLLECHWDPQELDRGELDFLTGFLTVPATKRSPDPIAPKIKETDDEGLYVVDWRRRQHGVRLYLDTMDDPQRRFWLGYSISGAAELDRILDRLSYAQPAIDRACFWPALILQMQELGEFRGVTLHYDGRCFQAGEAQQDPANHFRAEIRGGPETRDVLHFIERQEQLQHAAFPAEIRMEYRPPRSKTRFVLENIEYSGKLTTRGTSIKAHQRVVARLRSAYSDTISRIEERHIIRVLTDGSGDAIEGEPIFFLLDRWPIEDLDSFCDVVFSGKRPFRLWGTPGAFPGNENARTVSAVDLHNGSKLFFEIYHDAMHLYLYPGACGTTVARFFTNLQHTFSRLIKSEDNEGNGIF